MRVTTGIITYLPRPILFKIIEYFGKHTTGILHEACSWCKSRGSFHFPIYNCLKKAIQLITPGVRKLEEGIEWNVHQSYLFHAIHVHLPTRNTRPNHRIIWKLKSVNNKRGKKTYIRIYKSTPIDNFFFQTFMYK